MRPQTMPAIAHPGDALPHRARHVDVDIAAAERLVVAPGHDLLNTVRARLDALDAVGASFRLVAGAVQRISLMTGGAGGDGRPLGFHGPHRLPGPVRIVAGAAGCGIDEAGQRVIHCHAAFRDAEGRLVGGHLIPGATIAGKDGITVDLFALSRGRFRRRLDPETQFSIFHPEAA